MIEEKIKRILGQREIFGFFNLVHELDKELDGYFNIISKEDLVDSSKEDLYANVDMRALSTSYVDYYQIFCDLGFDKTLVDLGAGYCRGTLLAGILNRNCLSVEIDKNRSLLAKQVHPTKVLNWDLGKKDIPKADAYFIYLPWGGVTNNILRSIYKENRSCLIYIIESHGDFIENLSLYKEFKVESHLVASSKRHDTKIYKYRFTPSKTYSLIQMEDYKNKNEFPYWLLKFENKVKALQINSKTFENKIVTWKVDLKKSYACIYNKEPSIYFSSKSRYLQYQFDSITKIIYE